jgi:phosphopantetheinyl transferase
LLQSVDFDIEYLQGPVESLHIGLADIREGLPVKFLHDEEKKEIYPGMTLSRKSELVTSRFLQKKLAAKIGLSGDEFYIKKEASGKPVGYYNQKKYGVAISHTKNVVAAAIYEAGDVGLDVELKSRKTNPGIRERILNNGEINTLRDFQTLQIWTLKEAALKLTGTGLRTRMRAISIEPIENNNFQTEFNGKRITIHSYELQHIWLAVCYFE